MAAAGGPAPGAGVAGAGVKTPHLAWHSDPETISACGSSAGHSASVEGEARALVSDASELGSLVGEADQLEQERRRCLRRRTACLLAAGVSAAAVTLGVFGASASSSSGVAPQVVLFICLVVIVAVLATFLPLRRIGLLPAGSEVPAGAFVAWLLCLLLCVAAPGRKRRFFGAPAAADEREEHCEEGTTALWMALVLALVAALLPMPAIAYAVLSHLVCLQYLVLGASIPRPECTLDQWARGGPLLGLPPLYTSVIQLYLLALALLAVQYRLAAEHHVEDLAVTFARNRDPFQRNGGMGFSSSLAQSEEEDEDLVWKMGLETLLEEMDREERRWRRFLEEVRPTLPWGAPSRSWVAVIGVLMEVVSLFRQAVKSQAGQAYEAEAERRGRGLVERVLEVSARENLSSLEVVSQFVNAPMPEGARVLSPDVPAGGMAKQASPPSRRSIALKTIPGLSSELKISEWEFNAFEVDQDKHHHVLQVVGFELLRSFSCIPRDSLITFLERLEAGYNRDNPYHSHIHAADMCNSFLFLVTKCGLWRGPEAAEPQCAAMMLAALGHDVGHFGRNNMFLMSSRHELAITYNDRSVLENFHAATLMKLLEDPKDGTRLLHLMSPEQVVKARQLIVALILATDTSKHLEELGSFRLRLGADGFDPSSDQGDRQQALCMLFRAADIGHSAKAWPLHEEWSRRVSEEFHQQGDHEKLLGLKVSPLCEREGFKLAPSQVGFLQFVCLPTWRELARFEEIACSAKSPHTPTGDRNSRFGRNMTGRLGATRPSFSGLEALTISTRRGHRGTTTMETTPIVPLPVTTRGDVSRRSSVCSTSSTAIRGSGMSTAGNNNLGAVDEDMLMEGRPRRERTSSGVDDVRRRAILEVCLATCEDNFHAWKVLAETDTNRLSMTANSNRNASRHTTHTATETSSGSIGRPPTPPRSDPPAP